MNMISAKLMINDCELVCLIVFGTSSEKVNITKCQREWTSILLKTLLTRAYEDELTLRNFKIAVGASSLLKNMILVITMEVLQQPIQKYVSEGPVYSWPPRLANPVRVLMSQIHQRSDS